MSPSTNQEPPISDPVVMIGGRAYTVVYDLRAEFKLSEWDISPSEMMARLYKYIPMLNADGTPTLNEEGQALYTPETKGKWLFHILNLFAACVARNFTNEIAPTGEQWSARIAGEPGTLAIISKAVYDAMGKWLRSRTPASLQPQTASPSTSAPN